MSDLFDLPPRSRNDDPTTSHQAEKKLRRTGALNAQCERTLAALHLHVSLYGEFPTTWELARGEATMWILYSRRLSDLRNAMPPRVANPSARTCKMKGTRQMVWEPLVEKR